MYNAIYKCVCVCVLFSMKFEYKLTHILNVLCTCIIGFIYKFTKTHYLYNSCLYWHFIFDLKKKNAQKPVKDTFQVKFYKSTNYTQQLHYF